MANTITTTGTTSDPITTQPNGGQSAGEWAGDHAKAVKDAIPNGNKLTTTWTSANGARKTETYRLSGESDSDYLLRHIVAFMTAMLDNPPT